MDCPAAASFPNGEEGCRGRVRAIRVGLRAPAEQGKGVKNTSCRE